MGSLTTIRRGQAGLDDEVAPIGYGISTSEKYGFNPDSYQISIDRCCMDVKTYVARHVEAMKKSKSLRNRGSYFVFNYMLEVEDSDDYARTVKTYFKGLQQSPYFDFDAVFHNENKKFCTSIKIDENTTEAEVYVKFVAIRYVVEAPTIVKNFVKAFSATHTYGSTTSAKSYVSNDNVFMWLIYATLSYFITDEETPFDDYERFLVYNNKYNSENAWWTDSSLNFDVGVVFPIWDDSVIVRPKYPFKKKQHIRTQDMYLCYDGVSISEFPEYLEALRTFNVEFLFRLGIVITNSLRSTGKNNKFLVAEDICGESFYMNYHNNRDMQRLIIAASKCGKKLEFRNTSYSSSQSPLFFDPDVYSSLSYYPEYTDMINEEFLSLRIKNTENYPITGHNFGGFFKTNDHISVSVCSLDVISKDDKDIQDFIELFKQFKNRASTSVMWFRELVGEQLRTNNVLKNLKDVQTIKILSRIFM